MRRVCLGVFATVLPLAAAAAWVHETAPAPAQPVTLAPAQPQRELPAPPPNAAARQRVLATNIAPPPPSSPPTRRPRSRSIPPPPPAPAPCEASVPQLLAHGLEVVPRYSGGAERRAVALTFDDGPSQQNTPSVLRTLERTNTPATFFVLGERVEKMPELTARIEAAGHELGNHTWSHTSLRSLFKSQIQDELCRTSDAIEHAAGVRPTRFRPPFGRYPESALPLVAALGFEIDLWSVDADDWKHEEPEAMARDVVRQARAGSIILLHDRESITARALPSIIGGLRARGFEIVPLADL